MVVEQLERELSGDIDEPVGESELLGSDDEGQDILDLDALNIKFVAKAMERQEESPFCDIDVDSVEHDLGDLILEQVLRPTDGENNPNDDGGDVGFQPGQGQASSSSSAKRAKPPKLQLERQSIEEALAAWKSAVVESCTSVAEMIAKLQRFEIGAVDSCLGHEISLIMRKPTTESAGDTEVSFVSWVTPYKQLSGRAILLDEDNAVIYPSHFIAKTKFGETETGGALMILPGCGVRVKKKERQIVQPAVRRIRAMFEAGSGISDNGDVSFDDELPHCRGCQQFFSNAVENTLKRCSLCLMQWHPNCSRQAADHLDELMEVWSALMTPLPPLNDFQITSASELPFIFLSGTQPGTPNTRAS